ncbi:OmpA family protein [Coxiella-like endosymbiont of Rhipicephalus sanguineus]|uniref:OmpA family protein n=1 Tax=Coxiella-like endosymbiont of Rhipicephalus sanguineus TaxID=1955402 RepID=UPI00204178B9|nr:OmpA family protein [Coxiella-like endosymbiont of Rhipicephalus sanguineus]
MPKRFQWTILSMVILGLTACKSHTAFMDGGSAATEVGDRAKTYALVGESSYHGQVMQDSQGRIINPLLTPANQTYYFDFDSTAVRVVDLQTIHIQANYLAIHPKAKVRLEGNTDNRGSREYNIGLGWRRDQAIARIFEQEGVAPSQLDMVSYGKEHPAVSSNNEYAWRLNRRVNLIYEAY